VALLAGSVAASAAATCTASVYWEGFARPLADGRRHRSSEELAAHRTLPFGTLVRVTSVATGRSIVIPISDRGPFVRGRCIDLSRGAASRLGVAGLAAVSIDVLRIGSDRHRMP